LAWVKSTVVVESETGRGCRQKEIGMADKEKGRKKLAKKSI